MMTSRESAEVHQRSQDISQCRLPAMDVLQQPVLPPMPCSFADRSLQRRVVERAGRDSLVVPRILLDRLPCSTHAVKALKSMHISCAPCVEARAGWYPCATSLAMEACTCSVHNIRNVCELLHSEEPLACGQVPQARRAVR